MKDMFGKLKDVKLGKAAGGRPPAAIEIAPEGVLAAALPGPGQQPVFAFEPAAQPQHEAEADGQTYREHEDLFAQIGIRHVDFFHEWSTVTKRLYGDNTTKRAGHFAKRPRMSHFIAKRAKAGLDLSRVFGTLRGSI